MSNPMMEKVMKELHKYIDDHRDEVKCEDDYDVLVKRFMEEYNASIRAGKSRGPETADDYLSQAGKAETLKDRISSLRKALSLEPGNVDAQYQLILIENADKPEECLKALEKLIRKTEKTDEMKAYLEEDAGSFWGILETRPYMRLRHAHMTELISCGMMAAAAEEGRELMRLCETDNLGVRLTLMHLYAFMEDEENALRLFRRSEDNPEPPMLLALSVLYYKKQDYAKAAEYLQKLQTVNRDTRKFLRRMASDEGTDDVFESMNSFGYRPFTEEELAVNDEENRFLFESVPYFYRWAFRTINKRK